MYINKQQSETKLERLNYIYTKPNKFCIECLNLNLESRRLHLINMQILYYAEFSNDLLYRKKIRKKREGDYCESRLKSFNLVLLFK